MSKRTEKPVPEPASHLSERSKSHWEELVREKAKTTGRRTLL